MSNEDIKKMDIKEFEVYESNRMEKNAWTTSQLDDAPILGEYIKAFLTKKSNDSFFLNRDYLARSMEASEAKRKDLPGHAYFKNT